MPEKPSRRGRPALNDTDPSVPVTFSLPSKELTAVKEHAKHDRLTVQDWIRRVLRHAQDNSN
jgi:predicted DNA binding CopG/RHH family protein